MFDPVKRLRAPRPPRNPPPQVEVHCSERGAALAAAWNSSVDASEAAASGLRASNDALRERAAALAAANEELSREFKAVDFLRWEGCA